MQRRNACRCPPPLQSLCALTDPQLDLVLHGAQAVPVHLRSSYLKAIARRVDDRASTEAVFNAVTQTLRQLGQPRAALTLRSAKKENIQNIFTSNGGGVISCSVTIDSEGGASV